jgi:formiminotetrahydrofolate cyclodeaminase
VNTLSALVEKDARSYEQVSAAYKLPAEGADAASARSAAITAALLGAAEVPLETARACVEVCELALAVAERGNVNAVSDGGVAALLAEAACRGAAYNVRINVAALEDRGAGTALAEEAQRLVARAGELAQAATRRVEANL